MTAMLVHNVMSASPVTVSPTTSVADLLAQFDRHDFNAFPVVDSNGQVVGVVSKLDVLNAFLADREPAQPSVGTIASERVDALMTTDVLAVGPEDALVAAGELMVGTKLHSLPVVERRGGPSVLVGGREPRRRAAGPQVPAGGFR
ncbi:MAG: CBS domain-containing protein, partial [Gemmatimonadales bacterium]